MKTPVQAMVIALIVGALAGCSVDGTVTIRNESGSEFVGLLEGRGIALAGYESIEKTIKIGTHVLLFGPDEKTVAIEGESCTRTPFRDEITIENNGNAVYVIEPDASCVTYRNDSQYEVLSAFMRDADGIDWGPNRLDPELFPSTTLTERVAPGAYDFLMVDECGDSTRIEDAVLIPGGKRDVTHRGSTTGCGG